MNVAGSNGPVDDISKLQVDSCPFGVCVCVSTRVYHLSHDICSCECATHLCVLFVCTCLFCIYVHTCTCACVIAGTMNASPRRLPALHKQQQENGAKSGGRGRRVSLVCRRVCLCLFVCLGEGHRERLGSVVRQWEDRVEVSVHTYGCVTPIPWWEGKVWHVCYGVHSSNSGPAPCEVTNLPWETGLSSSPSLSSPLSLSSLSLSRSLSLSLSLARSLALSLPTHLSPASPLTLSPSFSRPISCLHIFVLV